MSELRVGRKAAMQQRRCSILQAARAVFARQGYSDTVVEDIATQAGIAKGTLYLYFPSKEQIYLAALVLEQARQLDADSRKAAMADAAGRLARQASSAYLQVRLNYFETHQDFLRIFMTEFRGMCTQGKPFAAEFIHLANAAGERRSLRKDVRGSGGARVKSAPWTLNWPPPPSPI